MSNNYENTNEIEKTSFKDVSLMLLDVIKNKSKNAKPKNKNEIPVNFLKKEDILNLEDYSVIRMGHSTLLFKIENEYILTDPVFSKRASPFSCFGPKRFHDVPISIEELPFIHSVIISHDHYDHLDKQSIKKLKNKVGTFYTSLEVTKHLQKFGIKRKQICELDWWQNKKNNTLEFVCTPSQHFSGRNLWDKNKTLWSSWVIKSPKGNFYFGADGGYFDGFKEIAFNHGPFEMVFLEVGAYNKRWKDIHMMPNETIQAFKDLNAKVLFPIHNGTFDLAMHSWFEPFEKIDSLAKQNNINIRFPIMGKNIFLLKFTKTSKWWKNS